MVAAGAALTLANAFSAASVGVKAVLKGINTIKDTLARWWSEFKTGVETHWPEFLTAEFHTGEDGWITKIQNWIDGLEWPSAPAIFTAAFHTGEEGWITKIQNWFDELEWPSFPDWEMPNVFGQIDGWIDGLSWPSFPSWKTPKVFSNISAWIDGLSWPSMPKWKKPKVLNDISTWASNLSWPSLPDWKMPDVFGSMTTWVEEFSWGDIWDDFVPDWIENFSMTDTLTGIGETLWNVIKGPLNSVVGFVNDMIDWDIPVVPGGTIGEILGIGNLAEFAKGGIVTGPVAGLVGEAGPEAIIPLSKDKLAEFGVGGGHTFNMSFNMSGMTDRSDKRQMAREISDLIQQEMRRTVGANTTRGRF